jgi:hypothetical protein
MLGRALSYAASRLASRAVDSVERRIVWGSISAVLMLAALVFVLTATFVYLQAQYGTFQSAIILAVFCAALGFALFWVPSALDRIEELAVKDDDGPAEELADAIDEEAREAVDTFGALQVAVSAFMLGLNAARGLKQSNSTDATL